MNGAKKVIKKGNLKITVPSENLVLALEERGFCAVLKPSGETTHLESREISDFQELVKNASVVWIDYIVDDFSKGALKAGLELGFSEQLLKTMLKNPTSGYEDLEKEMGIALPAIVVKEFDVQINPLLILIRENLIVTIHTTEVRRFFRLRRYAETLMKKLNKVKLKSDKITLMLIRIVDENNTRNFDHLKDIEEHGDKLSERLVDPKTPRSEIGKDIHEMKHALVIYLNGLWATIDSLNSLRYGDADLITDDPKIINRLNGLVSEVHSHISLAEHLSDVLASGLEVVQSIYNNQLQILNNRLALLVAYLTIIGTALLVPNTIATVVGSPMFEFAPKDLSWYIPLLIISTLVATVLAWIFVKKMGLLPNKPDSE
jgi:magnesium transporter